MTEEINKMKQDMHCQYITLRLITYKYIHNQNGNKNRYTNKVIFECEAESIKVCVEKAVKNRVNLNGADLKWADLNGANLSEADLNGADLSEADLWRANLSKANLSKANLNAIYYNTKVTAKQKRQIVESDLFEVIDSTS